MKADNKKYHEALRKQWRMKREKNVSYKMDAAIFWKEGKKRTKNGRFGRKIIVFYVVDSNLQTSHFLFTFCRRQMKGKRKEEEEEGKNTGVNQNHIVPECVSGVNKQCSCHFNTCTHTQTAISSPRLTVVLCAVR